MMSNSRGGSVLYQKPASWPLALLSEVSHSFWLVGKQKKRNDLEIRTEYVGLLRQPLYVYFIDTEWIHNPGVGVNTCQMIHNVHHVLGTCRNLGSLLVSL